ncbi:MAG TPA: hypothetical protein VM802_10170 [Chitinophaga sp.]|uniref:hypothetical protein n=1 Tax=Chitinophaga sp. TaxID=1869181 RepID=UPI002CD0980C|nr:hypothetical protein [Chitinophaga sp.]HVI45228.1 hypothetical protein [Chitinophaga sp.]
MIEQLKQLLFARGYRLFTRPFELNIIGVRSANHVPNAFSDHIYVVYMDANGSWQLRSYEATTDPGTPFLLSPINSAGAAILKPGQYKDCYAIGMHRGQYLALVQRRPVTVIRDYNRNNVPDYTTGKEQTGMFGINIHRAAAYGKTKLVDSFSAGCQVFADADNFQEFMQLAERHKQQYGNIFTYTLIQQPPSSASAAAIRPVAAALDKQAVPLSDGQ